VPLALLRAFIHFPFYGFIVLIQFMGIFLGGLGQSLWGWLRKARKPSEPAMGFSDSTALWMMLGPLEGMKDDEGSRLSFNRITADLPIRALRLFPILLLALWIWTGAEGEDSGERVDPFWLSLAATWWLGDFFLVAWLHRPLWMRRG
jgi:hypothetical protein